MAISLKLCLFLSFFAFFILYLYVWNLRWRPQFIFHSKTEYKTSFPGHVDFLMWRKTHSSLSKSQETLGIRLLNTIKLIVHMLMVSQNDEWLCCKFRMRSCQHESKIRFLIAKTSEHPTLWDSICCLILEI